MLHECITFHPSMFIPNQLLREAFSHGGITAQRLFVHIYPPVSIARYSFIQLSELKQCGMKKIAQALKWQEDSSSRNK